MTLATSAITTLIGSVITALNAAITSTAITGIVGVYFGDQEAITTYPVILVGAPPLLNENFPVMAGETVRDETYNIPILLFVEYADTLDNTKLLYNLTGAIRTALRANYLSGYVYLVELLQTRYAFAQRGEVTIRVSETTIKYTKRIGS